MNYQISFFVVVFGSMLSKKCQDLNLFCFIRAEHSTDSGAASGDHSPPPCRGEVEESSSSPGEGEKVHYKIGDLGHVACIHGGEVSPEEGDCRYMAPEFLEMEVRDNISYYVFK